MFVWGAYCSGMGAIVLNTLVLSRLRKAQLFFVSLFCFVF